MNARTSTVSILIFLAVIAIALSCSDDDKSTNSGPVLISVVVSNSMDAGRWTVCWDQTNSSGAQVAVGTYQAEITVGQFSFTDQFQIVQGGVVVPIEDCDTLFESAGGGQLPTAFEMEVADDTYTEGATVDIEVGIAARSFATLKITKP